MLNKLVPLMCCVALARAGIVPAAVPVNAATGFSQQTRSQDDQGNYNFGYDIYGPYGDENSRIESGDSYGNKKGSYQIKDVDGRSRRVDYVADEYGFRASINTNEPGTAPGETANAQYNGPAPLVAAPAYAAPAYAPAPARIVATGPAYAAPAQLLAPPTYAQPARVFAAPQFAPRLIAAPQFAPQQFAPQQFAPQQFAPQQFAPQQFAPQQFAPQQFAPQQFAPQQFAPRLVAAPAPIVQAPHLHAQRFAAPLLAPAPAHHAPLLAPAHHAPLFAPAHHAPLRQVVETRIAAPIVQAPIVQAPLLHAQRFAAPLLASAPAHHAPLLAPAHHAAPFKQIVTAPQHFAQPLLAAPAAHAYAPIAFSQQIVHSQPQHLVPFRKA